MERRIALIAVVLGCLLLAPNLLALPITVGTFNIAGTVTATVNNITWTSNQSPFPADTAAIGPSPTGIYSALGGTTATIDDLTRSTEPVTSSTFTAEPFLNFNANPSLSALDVNLIYAGQYSAAGCAASPADVGQTCTPSVPGANSPFSFTNTPPPPSAGGPYSQAQWTVSGVSADGLYTWTATFTSQFSESFQQVLSAFAPGGSGSVSNTYSATVTVMGNSPSVPEPGTATALGCGLVAMSVFLRRKFNKR